MAYKPPPTPPLDPHEKRVACRKAILSCYASFAGNKRMNSTQALELFCEKWAAQEIDAEKWVYSMYPTICRGTLNNWLKIVEEQGFDALAGKCGLHRKGTGLIDSQDGIKEIIFKGIKEGKTGVEIFANLKAELSQSSIKLPSLRRVQAWIKKQTEDQVLSVPQIPSPSLPQLYSRVLAMGQEIQYMQRELEKIIKNPAKGGTKS